MHDVPAASPQPPACCYLQGNPEFRQAESLLKSVDEDIVRDGLVGVGAGAAVIGVIGAIAYAALRKR